jgi:hypothetical protein
MLVQHQSSVTYSLRGNFTSTDDFKQQILNFITYFNRTLAKPFVWKFEGYPEVT